MAHIGWRFPPLSGGPQQGYTNNDIEVFKGQELIDNLAREICQNSLDAHLDESDEPVKVVFELKQLKRGLYDVFDQYEQCLAGCRNYWKDEMDTKLSRFVSGAEATLKKDTIPVLIASDYNTKGLTGSHGNKKSSSWKALTSSDGVSVKSDENSAGSYGIGKNAPFACSSLSMVFYNTVAEDNESAFIGVARLATLLNEDNKETQRVGKYQNNDDENEKWIPIYPEDKNEFRDCFHRTELGTDVIIVGFTQSKDWVANITKATIRNFFVAISEGRLIVELKEGQECKRIDADSLPQLISDFENDNTMTGTSQLYNAFINPDQKTTTSILETDDVEVYIKSDSSYKRTIANFRATGMLVGTYYKQIFQHYAAVVIVRGKQLGELLKDTEPPRHNRWDYKQIEVTEKDRRKLARDSIEKINDYVLQLLKSQFEVTTEDTIDAIGVGEYLPDEFDETTDQAGGDDILKPRIKIGNIKTNTPSRGQMTQPGEQEEGSEQGGSAQGGGANPNPFPLPDPKPVPNPQPRPHPNPHPYPIPPVTPPDDNPKPGTTRGNGTAKVITPNLTAQRAFPISSSQGLYKIVIKPAEDYSNMFIECFAVGEDGRSDALELESFTFNGQSISFNKGKAGPVKVEADKYASFFVRFKNKEKMKLRLQLTEEPKK